MISETRTLKGMQYEIYSLWHSIPLLSPSTPMFLKVVRQVNTCYYLVLSLFDSVIFLDKFKRKIPLGSIFFFTDPWQNKI